MRALAEPSSCAGTSFRLPPASCLQSETTWTLYTGQDEGCLFINYYVPAKAPPAGGFPVMFFMHGASLCQCRSCHCHYLQPLDHAS